MGPLCELEERQWGFFKTAFEIIGPSEKLSLESCSTVLEAIYKNEKKYFLDLTEGRQLTKIQKNLLYYLATQNKKSSGLFSQAVQKQIGVKSPGAMQNALAALQKKGPIYMFLGVPYFSNPFFRLWLLKSENNKHNPFVEPALW